MMGSNAGGQQHDRETPERCAKISLKCTNHIAKYHVYGTILFFSREFPLES
jgi:hypothetical protein